MIEHQSNKEAIRSAKELVERVSLSVEDIKGVESRWLVAAWDASGGEIKLAGMTTYRFPTGDFLAAVGHLSLACFEEAKRCLRDKEPGPLPWAKMGFPSDSSGACHASAEGQDAEAAKNPGDPADEGQEDPYE